MITDIKVEKANDLSKDNEVYFVDKKLIPANHIIAGASWCLASDNLFEAKAAVLKELFSLIQPRFPKHNIWLCTGSATWQQDSRIVRHRGLWKAHKIRNINIPYIGDPYEEVLESNGKLKFFGAKKVLVDSAEAIINLISEEHETYLLVLPEDVDVHEIIKCGWDSENALGVFLPYIIKSRGILLQAVGEFDDSDAGFVAFASPFMINSI